MDYDVYKKTISLHVALSLYIYIFFAFYLFLSFIYLTFALPSIFHLHISHTLSVCYTYDGQLQAAMTTMS